MTFGYPLESRLMACCTAALHPSQRPGRRPLSAAVHALAQQGSLTRQLWQQAVEGAIEAEARLGPPPGVLHRCCSLCACCAAGCADNLFCPEASEAVSALNLLQAWQLLQQDHSEAEPLPEAWRKRALQVCPPAAST